MQITEAHLDEAIRMAKAGGGMGHEYNQRSWCGTACCVLGFARLVAGLPEQDHGPEPGEIVDTPKGRMIAVLMQCSDAAILDVMERIQPDGTLDRPVHVDGNINLCWTALTHLPEGLTVGGSLNLGGCSALTHLPEGLIVGGGLNLSGCTSLTRLPEGLIVGGSLNLSGCTALTHLPDGLTVGGRLYLEGCTALTSLPDGLTVGCYLYGCTGLPDEKIPEHLRSKVVL